MIYIDRNLSQELERTEGLSNRAFVEMRAQMQPESGAAWLETAGALAMFDGIESPLTQTFGLGVFEMPTREHLDEIERFFREKNAPVFHEISPLADTALINLLNERGYQPIELTSVMFRPLAAENDLAVSINPQIEIRLIEPDEAELWAQISAAAWSAESPEIGAFMLDFGVISARSMLSFIAEIDSQPVATGAMFINGETALLAGASTLSNERGQGAQTALLAARLKYAAAQNCKIAMMGASPGSQSQRNAEKNNFRIAYTRTKWQLK